MSSAIESFSDASQVEGNNSCIPEGFVEILGPDDKHYVMPAFFAPAFHQSLAAYKGKKKLEIDRAAGTVSTLYFGWLSFFAVETASLARAVALYLRPDLYSIDIYDSNYLYI